MTTLETATAYRDAGLSVVPIKCDGSKTPARKTWAELQQRLPTDDELRADFGNGPCGVAIIGGAVSGGLTILDIDDSELVEPFCEALEEICPGLLEQLPQVQSPREGGGRHIYFRCAEVAGNEKLAERMTTDENGRPSKICMIETRAAGGYVVAPGSDSTCHATGRPYQHVAGPELTAVPKIYPQEREAILRTARMFTECHEPTQTKRESAVSNGAGTRPGDVFNERGDWEQILTGRGWTIAKKVRDVVYWLRPGKTGQGHSATTGFCTNGEGHDLLYVFSSNAHPFEAETAYSKFFVLAMLYYDGDFKAAASALAGKGYGSKEKAESGNGEPAPPDPDAEWETPTPFGHLDLPAFPVDALPPGLAAYVEAAAESIQVPIDMPAMMILGMIATATQKRIKVHVRGDWYEPTNLWTVVVMESGERKSPTFSELIEPLEEWERAQARELRDLIIQSRNRREILEKRLTKQRNAAAGASDAEVAASAENECIAIELELDRTPEIHAPRLISDDVTPEALISLLRTNGGRISIKSTEGGVFAQMQGRYSKVGSGANLDVYLKAFSGDTIRVDRVGRPPEHVPEPALSLCLCIQPNVIRGLLADPSLRGRGLLARFAYSLPKTMVGYRDMTPAPVPAELRTEYHRIAGDVLRMKLDTDDDGEPKPHIVRVGSDAWHVLEPFALEIEARMRPDGDLVPLRDWAAKCVGLVCRIAGVLHGADHGREIAVVTEITGQTMARAIRIGRYLLAHAAAAFYEMGSDPDEDMAKKIVAWIVAGELDQFKRRDAHRRFQSTCHKAEELDGPLSILANSGYIRDITEASGKQGGRRSPTYSVNPNVRK